MAKKLAGMQESLAEMKDKEIKLEDALKQAQQQASDQVFF